MENIAIYTPEITIYYSSIVIALGAVAFFAFAYAVYAANGGSRLAMLFFIPLCTVLSLGLSRLIHWYCHVEQYVSLETAMKDYSTGSFCIPGILLGIVLSVLLLRLVRLNRNAWHMLDCTAPAAALGLSVIRMSSLFNDACRSKIIITDPRFQHYPLAATVSASGGSAEYRFATFFAEALLYFVLAVVIMLFFVRHREQPVKEKCRADGNVFLMFLTGYGAIEFVLDSTRYDSSFFPFNGFISIVQISAFAIMLFVLVYYSIYSVKTNGRRKYHWFSWVGFLLIFTCAGVSEYLVQRHGDWYLGCYAAMSAAVIAGAVLDYAMYRSVCLPAAKPADSQPESDGENTAEAQSE